MWTHQRRLWLLVALGMGIAGAAVAGSAVYGYGSSRAEAAGDAERRVKVESAARFGRDDCYTPVLPNDCKADSGGWICIAYVANHAGSCGNITVRAGKLPGDGPGGAPGAPPTSTGGPLPPPRPGERIELAWFVTRLGEVRDVHADGPLRMTASQARAEKLRREAAARDQYGPPARIVLGITDDTYPCAFLFRMAGSQRNGFSANTTPAANDARARQTGNSGSVIVSGPACRP